VCSIASEQEKRHEVYTAIVACGVLTATGLSPVNAADISGAGATFPYPIYAKWADSYKKRQVRALITSRSALAVASSNPAKTVLSERATCAERSELNKDGLVQFPDNGRRFPVIKH